MSDTKMNVQEVKRVLNGRLSDNLDVISIYNITKAIEQKRKKLMKKVMDSQKIINKRIKESYGNDVETPVVYIKKFESRKENLVIEIHYLNKKYQVCFSKEDELYLKKANTKLALNVLYIAGDILDEIYDESLDFYLFASRGMKIKTINLPLTFKISCNKVSLYMKKVFSKKSLYLDYSMKDKSYRFWGLNSFYELIKNNEPQVFKNIYVKINDCPKMMQDTLREIRANELGYNFSSGGIKIKKLI